MKKKVLSLLITVTLLFTACNQTGLVGEQEKHEPGQSYSLGYLYFNDTRKVVLDFKEKTEVTLQVLTSGGELNVYLWKLKDKGGREQSTLYQGEGLPTGHWVMELDAGSYEFELEGHKHRGMVSLYYGNKLK